MVVGHCSHPIEEWLLRSLFRTWLSYATSTQLHRAPQLSAFVVPLVGQNPSPFDFLKILGNSKFPRGFLSPRQCRILWGIMETLEPWKLHRLCSWNLFHHQGSMLWTASSAQWSVLIVRMAADTSPWPMHLGLEVSRCSLDITWCEKVWVPDGSLQ